MQSMQCAEGGVRCKEIMDRGVQEVHDGGRGEGRGEAGS